MCEAWVHQNAWCLIRTRRPSQLIHGALMSLPLSGMDFWTPASSSAVCFSPEISSQINAKAALEASFVISSVPSHFSPSLAFFVLQFLLWRPAGRLVDQTSLEQKVYRPRDWASWISTKARPIKRVRSSPGTLISEACQTDPPTKSNYKEGCNRWVNPLTCQRLSVFFKIRLSKQN